MKKNDKELIIKLRDSAINGFNSMKEQFRYLEDGYLAVIDENQLKALKCRGKSHIPQKKIQAKVRRISREILKTYFANGSLAEIEVYQNQALTEILQKELDELTNSKLNLYTIMQPHVESVLVYGTGITKTYWSSELNRPKVQVKKIDEVLIDPTAKNHFDANFFVDRFYMSIADVKRNFKSAKKLDFKEILGDSISQSNDDIDEYKRVLIHEVYRKINGKWYVSSLLNDEFLRTDVYLKDGQPFDWGLAYSQFVRIDERNTVRSYGASYIEPMIAIQQQIIVTRNQQMDAIYKQLNPRVFASRNSGLRDDDLLSNNPKVIVNNLNEIREIPAPNISQSIFDINKLDEELQEVGGLPKFSQGITSQNDPKSATGISLLQESGNATIDDIVTSYNESFFEPLVRRLVMLLYKHKKSQRFANIDRDESPKLFISINAGMGAINKDAKINAIGSAKQSIIGMQKITTEQGLREKGHEYLGVLDEITIEELKALGIKNIEQKIKKGISENDIARQEQLTTPVQGQ